MYRKNGTDYNKGVTKAKRKWRDLYAPLYDERKKRNRNDFLQRVWKRNQDKGWRNTGRAVEKRWGYFSNKDNEVHRFDLCEECYDRMVSQFVIPVEKENEV